MSFRACVFNGCACTASMYGGSFLDRTSILCFCILESMWSWLDGRGLVWHENGFHGRRAELGRGVLTQMG